MKPVKCILLPLLLASILLVSISCKDKKPQEPEITYYDVVGVGYVFMCDSLGNILYPIQNEKIDVFAIREGKMGNFIDTDPKETFYSDTAGKYQIRFIKQHKQDIVDRYTITTTYYFSDYSGRTKYIYLSVDDVKNAQQIIKLDTFKIKY